MSLSGTLRKISGKFDPIQESARKMSPRKLHTASSESCATIAGIVCIKDGGSSVRNQIRRNGLRVRFFFFLVVDNEKVLHTGIGLGSPVP
jgi:hypothetical protein